jgi:hypothetical protein
MAGKGGGLLAILTKGKPAAEGGGDDEPDAGSSGDSVGKRAAQDALDAITAGDAGGLYDALERVVKACQGEGMMGGDE